ncbi:glycosyltransferase family A protein [Protaetiibacter intestinalis]|uniref:Glycosyltransferase family 2 protein n=1 Tax=Protaetiibacter intestinalis TaxID=2419774 RepID=A0A387BF42_9MICO|nr:glycosyltransferase family A protein [Protaetiibacter intestinalis]AYF99519.1 glycosyltransferase family 2 protein [Protaetiibacter intestinalis]
MSDVAGDADRIELSVVIPTFNAAPWLSSTLDAMIEAVVRSGMTAEIIVVDDGSTDETSLVLEGFRERTVVPLRVISQNNRGRFLARWAGVSAAAAHRVLLLDARVVLDAGSLAHVAAHPEVESWNGHVVTDPATPLVGRFWEVPTSVFWRHYLARPRPIDITSQLFDRVPKGTGCLIIGRDEYLRVAREEWPDEATAHLVSDDTKLLRSLVASAPLRLDPGFAAVYRPRTSVPSFLSHAFTRGTLFVDSYAGTTRGRNLALVALIALPPLALFTVVVLAGVGAWGAFASLLVAVVLALAALPVAALLARCSWRPVLSYLVYVLPFGAVFWAGLTRGAVVHRSAFRHGRGGDRITVESR